MPSRSASTHTTVNHCPDVSRVIAEVRVMADQGAASAAAGAAAGPLWTKHHSRSRNCPYYFNTKTGETSWDPPAVKAAVTLPTEVAPAVAVPHDPAGAGAARRDSARRDASRELGGHGTSQNGGSAPGSAAGRWRIDAQVRTADGGGVQDWREVVTLPAHADGPLEGRWVEVAFHTVLRVAADIEDVVRVRLLDLRGAVASQEPVCLYEWLRGERPTPRLHPRCIVWDADAGSSVSGHGARVPPPRRDPRARGDRDDRVCVLQPAAVLCHELWSGRGPTADGSSSVGLTEGVEPPPACTTWLEDFPAPPSLPQRGFRWAPAACEAMRFAATCPAVDDAPPGGLWCRMAAWVHNHVTASHRVELVAEMHRRAKVGEGYDALADYAERMRDRRADALAAAAPGRGRGLQAGVPVVVELLGFADRPLASMATAGEWSDFRVGRVHRPPKVMMLEQPLQPEIPTAPDEWRPPVTRELAIGPNETRYTMWTRDARPMLHTPYATAAIREATQRDLAAAAAGVDLDAVGDDPGNRRTTIDLLPSGVVSRVRVYADIGAGWGRFTKWMSYVLSPSILARLQRPRCFTSGRPAFHASSALCVARGVALSCDE
jgi:hypothetical protein